LWEIDDDWTAAEGHFSESQLSSLAKQLSPTAPAFFLVRPVEDDGVQIGSVQEFADFFAKVPQESVRARTSKLPGYKCESDEPFSERSGFLTRLRKLQRQDGPCVISLRTFAPFIRKRRRRCECYVGVAMHSRVGSASCMVVQRTRRNRVLSGGKRMCKANLARESPTLRR
jgi:hypothetical protein